MQAEVKSLHLEPDPRSLPTDPADFTFLARLTVGPRDQSGSETFDVQVCQKILPRLHGSKREIGPVLEQLIEFTAVGFPLSNEKLTRMKSRLEAMHFVSFAE